MQSAQSFLKGLLESNKLSPESAYAGMRYIPDSSIPIETVPFEYDHVLPNPIMCPRVAQLLHDLDNLHHNDYSWVIFIIIF